MSTSRRNALLGCLLPKPVNELSIRVSLNTETSQLECLRTNESSVGVSLKKYVLRWDVSRRKFPGKSSPLEKNVSVRMSTFPIHYPLDCLWWKLGERYFHWDVSEVFEVHWKSFYLSSIGSTCWVSQNKWVLCWSVSEKICSLLGCLKEKITTKSFPLECLRKISSKKCLHWDVYITNSLSVGLSLMKTRREIFQLGCLRSFWDSLECLLPKYWQYYFYSARHVGISSL
jgi:hypothetical protein